jgi:hypothetical protein
MGKPQSFYTIEFGPISHKKITETFRSKFKAKPYQTGGADNKRCLIFSKDVLERIAIYYDNPDKIEILPDVDDREKESKKESGIPTNNRDDSGITDQSPSINKEEDIKVLSEQDEQTVTDVTNITDSSDAKALDKISSDSSSSRNIENNSNITDKIPNSYNNISNDLATTTEQSPSNNTSVSSSSVISVTSVTKKCKGNTKRNDVSLDLLPDLSCLFCSTYKTKIRFDMELHLFEMHKQNLVYNLPIGKARMDDRIEYALKLIEQRLVVIAEPDQSNYGD